MRERCAYPPWNPDARCERRAVIGDQCVRHWWDGASWVWEIGCLHLSLNLWPVNRPYFQLDECRPREWVALSWGNSNSDPVWSLFWRFRKS